MEKKRQRTGLFGSDKRETWPTYAIDDHRFAKHRRRTHPQAEFAVECLVHHEFFAGLRVRRGTNHAVFLAFVMLIAARREIAGGVGGAARRVSHGIVDQGAVTRSTPFVIIAWPGKLQMYS